MNKAFRSAAKAIPDGWANPLFFGYELFRFSSLPLPATLKHVPASRTTPCHQNKKRNPRILIIIIIKSITYFVPIREKLIFAMAETHCQPCMYHKLKEFNRLKV